MEVSAKIDINIEALFMNTAFKKLSKKTQTL